MCVDGIELARFRTCRVRVRAVINSALAQICFEVGLNALGPAAAQSGRSGCGGGQPGWLAARPLLARHPGGAAGWVVRLAFVTVFRSAIKGPSILNPPSAWARLKPLWCGPTGRRCPLQPGARAAGSLAVSNSPFNPRNRFSKSS